MNKNIKNSKNSKNINNTKTTKTTSRTNSNKLDSISNNMKNTPANTRPVPTRTASRPVNRAAQQPVRTSPIVESPTSTNRSKTYIVLVWQSRSAGVIRRIMEVPGTQLTRTLDNIRMQKKAFSFYEKR